MEPKYSKQILKLPRVDLKHLIEIITGHNNLKSFSTKIKQLNNTQCRLCNEGPENIIHLMTECKKLDTERYELKLARFNPTRSTMQTLTWSIPLTLEFFKLPQLLTLLNYIPGVP